MSALAWPLLLLAFGLLLLFAEVFVPSGGLIGVLALGCLGLGLWRAFRTSNAAGLLFLAADFVLIPAALTLAMYLWPKLPLANRVFLKPPGPGEVEGSHAGLRLDHLVGQLGRSLTPLRPSGLVDFDGRRLDGVCEEGWADKGALIVAVRVRSGQVVVRVASEATADGAAPEV
jgi:membrane-bound serine protease (ClpP class)